MLEEILTIREACQFLKISKPTMYRYIQDGKVPAVKVGGAWRFHRELLNNWMKQQMHDDALNRGKASLIPVATEDTDEKTET